MSNVGHPRILVAFQVEVVVMADVQSGCGAAMAAKEVVDDQIHHNSLVVVGEGTVCL